MLYEPLVASCRLPARTALEGILRMILPKEHVGLLCLGLQHWPRGANGPRNLNSPEFNSGVREHPSLNLRSQRHLFSESSSLA